jgi:hypothetical protein
MFLCRYGEFIDLIDWNGVRIILDGGRYRFNGYLKASVGVDTDDKLGKVTRLDMHVP